MIALFKNVGTLALLLILLPINSVIVLIALLLNVVTAPLQRSRSHKLQTEPPSQKILLTGGKMTKALQLARSFHAAGHAVVLVETDKYWLSGHRFSRAVQHFYTVPVPEKDPEGYTEALLRIVQRENIQVFIPVSSPVSSYYDSLAGQRLAPSCQVLHFSSEITEKLDDKFTFCAIARSLGLSTPQSFLITHPQQILDFDFTSDHRRYILKSIRYNSVSRLNLTPLPCPDLEHFVAQLPISPDNPWIMQELITGQEYCTHSTVRQGQVRLHCCSRSSPFQVNYEHVDKPEILEWIEQFVAALNLTGQISFDFIQTPDGVVYPIECNPRAHSAITLFYNHPGLAEAYLQDRPAGPMPITPLPHGRPTYWLYHELWRVTDVRSWADFQHWSQRLLRGKDAIFQMDDPLPFLAVPHWQITLLLLKSLWQFKDWVRIDFNIGKLVQLGGD